MDGRGDKEEEGGEAEERWVGRKCRGEREDRGGRVGRKLMHRQSLCFSYILLIHTI